jgi:hypothetical protein
MSRVEEGWMTESEFNEYKEIYNIPYNFENIDVNNGRYIGNTILVQDYFLSNFENGQRGKVTYIATIIGKNTPRGTYGNFSGLSENSYKLFLNEYVPTRIVGGTQRYGILKEKVSISEGILGSRETSIYYEPGDIISDTGLSNTTIIGLPNYNPPATRRVKGIRISPVRTPENTRNLQDIKQKRERERNGEPYSAFELFSREEEEVA